MIFVSIIAFAWIAGLTGLAWDRWVSQPRRARRDFDRD